MAFFAGDKEYFLTSLGWRDEERRELEPFDAEILRDRAGLKILDNPDAGFDPAEKLVFSTWGTLSEETVSRLIPKKCCDIMAVAKILKGENLRYKVWWASFTPTWAEFRLITQWGEVRQETLKMGFYYGCSVGELRVIKQDEPETVLTYYRRTRDEVRMKILVGDEIVRVY